MAEQLDGDLSTAVPTQIFRLEAVAGGEVRLGEFAPEHNLLVYLLSGSLTIGGERVEAYETVLFENDGTTIDVTLDEGADVLILAGQRIDEPVVFGGPFVMNHRAEIAESQALYRAGAFGKIPERA